MEYNDENISVEEITEDTAVVAEDKNEAVIEFANWEIKMIFNPALASVKLSDLPKEDKINLIKMKIEFGKAATTIQEYEKTVVESLKNDEFSAIEKSGSAEGASAEDKSTYEEALKKLEKDANEICIEKYNETVKIVCEKISESTFYAIAETFDIAALGGYDYIYNKLVK